MGRKRKVDRDTARQSALSAFWVNGYSGLGVRQLEELTGINRFAVQTEFGGKDGLFLDIASLYCSVWIRTDGEKLRKGPHEDFENQPSLREAQSRLEREWFRFQYRLVV